MLSVKSKLAEALSESGIQKGFENILVPTDVSKPPREVVTHALDLTRTYDATLHDRYVVDRGACASRPGWTWDELQQILEQNGETVVEDIQTRAAADDVSVTAEITYGGPHQAGGEYCDQDGIDLVAMGTQGRSGSSRRLIGSVAEQGLRNSDEPVLTIRGV